MSALIVLADGCFDPFHVGHLRYLKYAAGFGPLIVNVAPDHVIAAKGRLPFQTRVERIEFVRGLACVTSVCALTLPEAIRGWKPTWLVKGKDWEGKLPMDVIDACKDVGTRIIFSDTMTRSSSERLTA